MKNRYFSFEKDWKLVVQVQKQQPQRIKCMGLNFLGDSVVGFFNGCI
jgi:hypothetical protein